MRVLFYEARIALAALQFFTRLPVPFSLGTSPEQLARCVRYLPLAGIVVGAVTGFVYALAAKILPHAVAVALSIIAGLTLTGAFHEDGLADACDGFGSGSDASRVLEIMKDPRVGSYGAIGLSSALLLKFVSLNALPPSMFVATSIGAHAFSRLMALSIMYTQAYVREDQTTKIGAVARRISTRAFSGATLIGVAPLALLGGGGLAAGVAACTARVVAARYCHRRIGGYTGDVLGAVQQISELTCYLGLLAWMSI